MRLVAEHRSEGPRDTERVVRIYTGDVREVIKADSNGEWWNRYVIIPRSLVIDYVRKIRSERRISEWWEVIPPGASSLIGSEHHSGPGQPFTRMPYRVESSRKFIVIYQSGGLDI